MKCDKTKKIVSLVLLLAAILIYFLTDWTIWIPIILLVLAVIRFFSKHECKVCSPQESSPVKEALEEDNTDEASEEEKEEILTKEPVKEPVEAKPVKEALEEDNTDEAPEEIEEKKEV